MFDITVNNVTPFNIFYLNTNFNKSTIELNYIRTFFMLAKFEDD